MIKIVYAWRDRPTLSTEECEAHYRSTHMRLAREAFTDCDGFVALRYNRVRGYRVNDYNDPESREATPDVDAWVELYFENEDKLQAAFARPELAAMFDDHENFMATEEPENIRIYRVEEETILAAADPVASPAAP